MICVRPQQRSTQPALVQGCYRDALIAGIRGDVSPQELEQLGALLDRMESDPQGKILVGSMQAFRERFGVVPEIVLVRDGQQFNRPSLLDPALGEEVWHLNLRRLSGYRTFDALYELAAVYCNIAGMPEMREDAFAAYTLDPDQKLDPALEKAWVNWIAAGERGVHHQSPTERARCSQARSSIVEHLRMNLKEMQCYGGLVHRDFNRFIRGLRYGNDGWNDDGLSSTASEISLCPSFSIRRCGDDSDVIPALRDGGMEDIGPYQHRGAVREGCDSSLPPLPPDLHGLCLDGYPRPDLSQLPIGLKVLRIRNAGLTEMPQPLPPGLKALDVSENSITRWDGPLPEDMETLIVSNNPLEELPESLPRGLRRLEADRTRLRRVHALPSSAVYVSMHDNALTALPALPRGLRSLLAQGNGLTEIPEDLPLSLRHIELENNQLRRLPPAIANLAGCDIFLEGNPIARQDIPRPPDGVLGPRIFHSMQADPPAPQREQHLPQGRRNLAEAANAWLSRDAPQAAQRWQALGNPAEADQFALFLDRLRYPLHDDPKPFKTEAFRANVMALLTELSLPERAALRADVFALCTGATETCDDRVLWTLNQFKALLLNDDIRMGRYDDRIHEVIQAGREMFSLEVLDGIAREKVKTLTRIDEVEVYLSYAVKLRQALGLNSIVPDMLFYNDDDVGQSDLDDALQTVRRRQLAELPMFLALDYAPWQSLLRRREPKRHDAAQAALHEEIERCLEPELQSRLQALGLDPHDEDARRVAGHAISRDIRYRVLGPLTAEYLVRYGRG
jgi:hypothetical protein